MLCLFSSKIFIITYKLLYCYLKEVKDPHLYFGSYYFIHIVLTIMFNKNIMFFIDYSISFFHRILRVLLGTILAILFLSTLLLVSSVLRATLLTIPLVIIADVLAVIALIISCPLSSRS